MPPSRPNPTRHTFRAGPEQAGERLDRALSQALGQYSRARLKSLIEQGLVERDGATIAEPSHRVKPGEIFTVTVPETAPTTIAAQELPLRIAFEDADLVVVDKPAGLVVHPAPGNPDRTLVNALIAHCGDSLKGIGGELRPGIVHRLDKDTSGLLVAAKSETAMRHLADLFARHAVERAYRALVWGVPARSEGRIEGNIGRDPRNRKRMAIRREGGKPAATRWRVLERFGEAAALIECRLETGRTHQIRVHMTALGHPLIGDPVYGRASRPRLSRLPAAARALAEAFPRQALHAGVLGFPHPADGRSIRLVSEIPDDMQRLLLALRGT